MNAGTFIKQKRGERSMSSLAKAIGVSVGYMSDVEHGRRALTDERIEQVAAELCLTSYDKAVLVGLNSMAKDRVSFALKELTQAGRAAVIALSAASHRLSSREWDAIEKIARGS